MSALVIKTQLAIASAITALALEWPASIRAECSRGQKDEDPDANPASNELPAIIVGASSAQQLHPNTATAYVSVTITVRHQADESNVSEAVEPQVRELGEWIMGDDFCADCTAALSGFTAFGRKAVTQNYTRSGRRFETTFDFELLAAPGDLS